MAEKVEEVVTEEVVEVAQEVAGETKDVYKEINATLDRINADQDELARKQVEFFNEQVEFKFKENGLEAFTDIFNIESHNYDQLNEVVAKLTGIVNGIKAEAKVSAGYVPKDNAKQAEYTVFTEKKDVRGMIGSKLANLFK